MANGCWVGLHTSVGAIRLPNLAPTDWKTRVSNDGHCRRAGRERPRGEHLPRGVPERREQRDDVLEVLKGYCIAVTRGRLPQDCGVLQ